MYIIPAVDIKNGACVRLKQGIKERATVYSDTPYEVALKWELNGAQTIHVVDLDGAFAGEPKNEAAIRDVVRFTNCTIQVGGGIRTIETVERYLSFGVSRVVLGTSAVENASLVAEASKKFPGRIVVGIDAKNGKVATKGWVNPTDITPYALAKKLEGYGTSAIIYTDISRDGMMAGCNVEAVASLAESIQKPVIASGGVSSLEDIKKLMAVENKGVTGIIIGKALYTGTINLYDAISLAKGTFKC